MHWFLYDNGLRHEKVKCALFSSLFPLPSIKVGLVGLLRKKVKQYPVFYDKQIKEYREKDAVSNV